MNSTQQQYWFNRARCECQGDTISQNGTGYFRIAVQQATTTSQKITNLLENCNSGSGIGYYGFYAGTGAFNCLDSSAVTTGTLASVCTNLETPTAAQFPASGNIANFENANVVYSQAIAVSTLFGSLGVNGSGTCGATGTCSSTDVCANTGPQAVTVYYFVSTTGSTTNPDTTSISFTINISGQEPYTTSPLPPPGQGDGALDVNWGWPSSVQPGHGHQLRWRAGVLQSG